MPTKRTHRTTLPALSGIALAAVGGIANEARAEFVVPDLLADRDVVFRYEVSIDENANNFDVGDIFYMGYNINIDGMDSVSARDRYFSSDTMRDGIVVFGDDVATFENGITDAFDDVPNLNIDRFSNTVEFVDITQDFGFGAFTNFVTLLESDSPNVYILPPGGILGLFDVFAVSADDFANASFRMDVGGGTIRGGVEYNFVPAPGALGLLAVTGLAGSGRVRHGSNVKKRQR